MPKSNKMKSLKIFFRKFKQSKSFYQSGMSLNYLKLSRCSKFLRKLSFHRRLFDRVLISSGAKIATSRCILKIPCTSWLHFSSTFIKAGHARERVKSRLNSAGFKFQRRRHVFLKRSRDFRIC